MNDILCLTSSLILTTGRTRYVLRDDGRLKDGNATCEGTLTLIRHHKESGDEVSVRQQQL